MAAQKLVRLARPFIDILLLALFLVSICWLVLYRADTVNRIFGAPLGCEDCFSRAVVAYDWLLLCVLSLIFLASFVFKQVYFYVLFRAISLLGLVIYFADIIVLDEFFSRLRVSDIRMYGGKLDLIWRHIEGTGFFQIPVWGFFIALGVLLALMFFPPGGGFTRRFATLACGVLVVMTAGGSVIEPDSYVHEWALRNVVDANLNNGVSEPYSETFKAGLLKAVEKEGKDKICGPGLSRRPDIVLLILESWSPYQSRLLSGLRDWTPRLDRIARDNAWYSRFHAGGFTTNEGLISLLTGLDYISPVKSFFHLMPFETAWQTDLAIPRGLNKKGYFTAFLTSGNLSFSDKGKWLRDLDFQFVEGHDYPGYDGIKRLHFDSVPDEALYRRSLDLIDEYAGREAPLFLTIETVSTHHPYIHPETGERTQEAVFRYMDRTAGDFYERLDQRGFFDNGVLIIVSDHRAMIPITREEESLWQAEAASRIPAIVAGMDTLSGQITKPFHQSDLVTSLAALTSDRHCYLGSYRNLFEPEASQDRCLYHARGDNRDHIDAICPGWLGRVKLDGDRTRLISPDDFPPPLAAQVVNEVNYHRITGDERTRTLIEKGYFD